MKKKKKINKKKQVKKDTWVVLFHQKLGGREKLEMYQLLHLTKIEWFIRMGSSINLVSPSFTGMVVLRAVWKTSKYRQVIGNFGRYYFCVQQNLHLLTHKIL